MCGILGTAFVNETSIRTRLPQALNLIAHRGPDGEGKWEDRNVSFGHRRLAIIDLSDGGNQPMIDPETGAVLIQNGEIYNYIELRSELAALGVRFRTASDTEVLLKALLYWGVMALPRLNGMWAFALWRPDLQTLMLCRDRFGVKPLYYAEAGGGTIFGSEPKALLALQPSLSIPSLKAINDLIVSSSAFSGAQSFFRDIYTLPPATYAILTPQNRKVKPNKYWSYPEFDPITPNCSREDGREQFSALFDDAVKLRLRSDVSVGLTLSGGLDSSAILASASHNDLALYTASFGNGSGEEYWAYMAADKAKMNLNTVVVDSSKWLESLEKIVWHMDGPGYSPPVFALWEIMKQAKRNDVPVLLEGQGADELLGGYVQHAAAHFWDLCRSGKSMFAAKQLPRLSKTFGPFLLVRWLARQPMDSKYRDWQSRYGRGRMLRKSQQDLPESSPSNVPASKYLNMYDQLIEDHSRNILPSLLQYEDAISMAHGIESRLPFMDYRLVEWVFRERPELIQAGRTKIHVREHLASKGYRVLANRADKKGFTTPTAKWFADNQSTIAELLFANPNARLWDYIDYNLYRHSFANKKNDWSASHSYKLLTTEIWLQNLNRPQGLN